MATLDDILRELAANNPPNLRMADSDDRRCWNCTYFVLTSGETFSGIGRCTVGNRDVPTRADFVCDLFEPSE